MRSIRTAKGVLALATMLTVGAFAQAEASVISVVPASQNKNVGDVVTADIRVSGLTALETVGAFSFLVSFSDAVLNDISYTITGMGPLPADFSVFGAGSPGNFFVLADFGISEPALKAIQGSAFTLATLTFNAVAAGVSALDVSNVVLSNFDGTADLDVTSVIDGRVCVGPNCVQQPPNAPEPATLFMLGGGIVAAAAVRSRRRRQSR